MRCSICKQKGHKKNNCGTYPNIKIKFDKYSSYSKFYQDQANLCPSHAVYGGRQGGGCQGWYVLSSKLGVHYIGLVGQWDATKKAQSDNTFFKRWTEDKGQIQGHDTKGGFGTNGTNGSWPPRAMVDGKLLSRDKCSLHLAPVINVSARRKRGAGSAPSHLDSGVVQAKIIEDVEKYMIHKYANKHTSRAKNNRGKSLLTSKYAFPVKLKANDGTQFNVSNTASISTSLLKSLVYLSGCPPLLELYTPKETMNDYQKNL